MLRLEEGEGPDARCLGEVRSAGRGEELLGRSGGVEDPLDVEVARRPRVGEKVAAVLVEQARRVVPQEVEGRPQRAPPRLVPPLLGSRLAAAVAAPAADPVRAAPGGAGPVVAERDLDLVRRGTVVEVLAVVRRAEAPARRLLEERVGEAPVAEVVVVPVALPVRRHVDEAPRPLRRLLEPVDEGLARREPPLEGDRPCDRAVVEEEGDRAPRPVAVEPEVRARGVDAAAADVHPGGSVRPEGPHPGGLLGREDGVLHPLVDQRLERRRVDGALGEPHRLGLAGEATDEVRLPPPDLRGAVARVAEGKDRVVVGLGDRVPVPPPPQGREPVRLDDPGEGRRVPAGHPGRERRADVEAELLVVVDDPLEAPPAVQDPGQGVRPVALGVDPLVPVVPGGGARLAVDVAGPGVLSRRLVEVTVDDQGGAVEGHVSSPAPLIRPSPPGVKESGGPGAGQWGDPGARSGLE